MFCLDKNNGPVQDTGEGEFSGCVDRINLFGDDAPPLMIDETGEEIGKSSIVGMRMRTDEEIRDDDVERDVEIIKRLREDEQKKTRNYRMTRRPAATEYFCEKCNKKFRHPSKIAEHMRVHSGDKPFACSICGARFSQRHPLKVHQMRMHSHERPYKCSYCTKCFTTVSHCKSHEKIHLRDSSAMTKNSTVSGEVCSFDLAENGDVDADLANGEPLDNNGAEEPAYLYACAECNFTSFSGEEVEDHYEMVHAELNDVYGDGGQQLLMSVDVDDEENELDGAYEIEEMIYGNMDPSEHDELAGMEHGDVVLEEVIVSHDADPCVNEAPPTLILQSPIGNVNHHKTEVIADFDDEPSTSFGHALHYAEDGFDVSDPLGGDPGVYYESDFVDAATGNDGVICGPDIGDGTSLLELAEHTTQVSVPYAQDPEGLEEEEEDLEEEVVDDDTHHHFLKQEELEPMPGPSGVDDVVPDHVAMEEECVSAEDDTVAMESRVRVFCDPRPPKRGRSGRYADYLRVNEPVLTEVEVDASVVQMALTRTQSTLHDPVDEDIDLDQVVKQRTRPARNLDWIIDAVARGLDVDLASPHNRKKPVVHECEYCGKVFKYPSKIEAHMRTHTGERPYKCDICGAGFTQRTPLRMHVRRHLDQKPFICLVDTCHQRFVSGALLNHHQLSKHFGGKRRHVCMKGCGRTFASVRSQRTHEERCPYRIETFLVQDDVREMSGLPTQYSRLVPLDDVMGDPDDDLNDDRLGVPDPTAVVDDLDHELYMSVEGDELSPEELSPIDADAVGDDLIANMQPNFLE